MAELSEQKQQARAMWGVGDYASVAHRLGTAGRKAVEAAAIGTGDRVLDVACGTGNATIPAAQAGAEATGLDLTPSLLEAGRAEAKEAGVEIEWVEGDAEQLPFEDGSFDAVISVFGCMFAPDQSRTAAEIARVLKPGGRIGICSWTPEGNVGKMFTGVAGHMPPPPEGFQPPLLWGTPEHVTSLFEPTGVKPEFERDEVVFEAASAEEFLAEYREKLPPLVAARAALEPEGKFDALYADLLKLYEEADVGEDGSYRQPAEYLVAKGTKTP
jgi:SAM-dependent methyltransferase